MSKTIYAMFGWLFWFCGRLFFRLTYYGLENLPKRGAVLLVANHASFMDPPMLGCGLPRPVRYMARSTLNRIPVFAWVLRRLGVLFVEREGGARAGLELGIGALHEGDILGLFPEGTRTRDGEIGPFKRGLLLILQKCGERGIEVAVVPVGIRGSYRAWPRGRWFPKPSRCEVHIGKVLSSAEVLADHSLHCLRQQVSILAGNDRGQEMSSASERFAETGDLRPSSQISSGHGSDRCSFESRAGLRAWHWLLV